MFAATFQRLAAWHSCSRRYVLVFDNQLTVIRTCFIWDPQLDPHKRLGVGPGGPDTVMKHPYFKGVDWDAMLEQTAPSPIKVALKGPGDVSNFEDDGDDDVRKPLKWKGPPHVGDYGGAFDHF